MTPFRQNESKYVANRGQGLFMVAVGIFVAAQKMMGVHYRGEHHNEVWWIAPALLLLGLYIIRRHGRLLTETPDHISDIMILLGSLASFMAFAAQSVGSQF